ncbi:MAG: DUF2892 domain-containing protein [Archangium gephyra]|uniref:DUF2892 domain-containing protein n=1 Tax=Archangium gephyra TaxID=48 RepID=A0A2W5THD6_9BACT|nr:MAG: DUF2892 domain-containing protein [Archangium gephyra]
MVGSTALALLVDARFGWLTAASRLVMIQSSFTGSCPVHYTVNKLLPPG